MNPAYLNLMQCFALLKKFKLVRHARRIMTKPQHFTCAVYNHKEM